MSASLFLARVLSIVLVVTLAACAYPTRNQEAQRIGETHGYRWGIWHQADSRILSSS